MSEVEITVGGRKYSIACNAGEESDVLAASEELDKEARNITNAIGKVSDVKLLLMAGLMISGRLKTFEKKYSTRSIEISKLNEDLSTLKTQNQKLSSLNKDVKDIVKTDNTKPYIDEVSVTNILKAINNRLNRLIEESGINYEEKNKENQSAKIKEPDTDQKELF